jgi:hypothetical protein
MPQVLVGEEAYGAQFELKYPSSCPHPKKAGNL